MNECHPYMGMRVTEVQYLPIDETLEASDIETRQKIHIDTGRRIHIIRYGSDLLVSPQIMAELMKLPVVKFEDIQRLSFQ